MRTAAAFTLAFAVVACLLCAGACPKKSDDPAVNRGKQAYMGTCIACHNMNPAVDGAIGPAIKGASKELLTARIVKAEYPAGYTPRRNTHLMPAQPQLAGAVDDIAAYLASP